MTNAVSPSATMPHAAPVRYRPDCETVQPDEAQTNAELVETMLDIANTMHEHTGHGMRSVHAKSFGLVRGELTVLPGLLPELAQGVFAQPGTHEIVARFSTPPAEELDDRVSLPRGLALKILGVPGERLPGSEASTSQDFLMVNGPVFNAPDAAGFLKSLKLLAATTDRAPTGKRMLSVLLRGTAKALDAVGVESPTLVSMGGHPETHPLGETFFTQLPLRHGDYIAKLQVAPVAPSLTALTDQPLDVQDAANGLREAVNGYFAAHDDAEWELRVQLCTDLETMPIEDASVEWTEDRSPFVAVARLRIPRQTGWSEERSRAVDDGMAFDPWNGVAAHQPLGNVMRARREAYKPSAAFRARVNGCPMHAVQRADEVLPLR